MFMATKTLTITEEAYNLLAREKKGSESFSMEITRVMGGRRPNNLMKYFGILSEEEGEGMLKILKKKKVENAKILRGKMRAFE